MKILQVMPIIIPHTSRDSSCLNIPEWLGIGLLILLGLILLAILIGLIRMIFDF